MGRGIVQGGISYTHRGSSVHSTTVIAVHCRRSSFTASVATTSCSNCSCCDSHNRRNITTRESLVNFSVTVISIHCYALFFVHTHQPSLMMIIIIIIIIIYTFLAHVKKLPPPLVAVICSRPRFYTVSHKNVPLCF